MKKAMLVALTIFLMLSSVKITAAFTTTTVKPPWDSKPAQLSVIDKVWLSEEPIVMNGITKINVLVNRVTRKVEYVWSYKYNRYVRPQLSMPNIQALYNQTHSI